jgi:hypothetical protein
MSTQQESFAEDIYRINNPNSLVTANHQDLATFMALNARHMTQAVREMYRRLESEGALFNLQPGALVKVVEYYDDGIARIEWGGGEQTGYIAKNDLSSYLGSV